MDNDVVDFRLSVCVDGIHGITGSSGHAVIPVCILKSIVCNIMCFSIFIRTKVRICNQRDKERMGLSCDIFLVRVRRALCNTVLHKHKSGITKLRRFRCIRLSVQGRENPVNPAVFSPYILLGRCSINIRSICSHPR